jgi:SNF2 family DNA or RNA helicase
MTYRPALAPRKHQKEGLKRLLNNDTFGLLADMGTGKTKMLLDEWGMRTDAGEQRDMLIIAPASFYLNWLTEAKKHLDPAMFKRTRIMYWQSGAPQYWERTMRAFMAIRDPRIARLLLVNIEALSKVDACLDLCEEFLGQRGAIMGIDESTRIRTYDSNRTLACHNIGQAAQVRRIATGLIAPRSPLDIWAQFAFLDKDILKRDYWAFRARYSIIVKQNFTKALRGKDGKVLHTKDGRQLRTGPSIFQVVGHRNLEELRGLMESHSFLVNKKDCLDIPDKVYTEPRAVPMTGEQMRVYRDLLKKATAELDGGSRVTALMMITSILRRHQVLCGHVKDDLEVIHPVKSNRNAALLEVLEEHEGKAIIWAPYDYNIREIVATLEKEYWPGVAAAFWGGNVTEREGEEARWKEDPNCLYMVSTQSSGGMGRTWIEATLVVYYANTHDLAHRLQSEDRAHRDGQRNVVTYVDLICKGTVEEKIVECLRNKINIVDLLHGDERRKWLI